MQLPVEAEHRLASIGLHNFFFHCFKTCQPLDKCHNSLGVNGAVGRFGHGASTSWLADQSKHWIPFWLTAILRSTSSHNHWDDLWCRPTWKTISRHCTRTTYAEIIIHRVPLCLPFEFANELFKEQHIFQVKHSSYLYLNHVYTSLYNFLQIVLKDSISHDLMNNIFVLCLCKTKR